MLRHVTAVALVVLAAATARADETTNVAVPGGTIELVRKSPEAETAAQRAVIDDWIRRAAHAVSSFDGHFPVKHVRIVLARVSGSRIGGTTYGGHTIEMRLGVDTSSAELAHDWTLTHEMLHLSFPDVERQHQWMQEGLATYFEPIARARVGDVTPDQVWRDLFEGLPKGLPGHDDHGLDRTPTWGRTYWGGALFWFLADLGIRERTGNRHSADDALRGILAAGGDGDADWTIARILETGDRATGTNVLVKLYDQMATHPFPVDVPALAARLGVTDPDHPDDSAPLANVRRAITSSHENGPR